MEETLWAGTPRLVFSLTLFILLKAITAHTSCFGGDCCACVSVYIWLQGYADVSSQFFSAFSKIPIRQECQFSFFTIYFLYPDYHNWWELGPWDSECSEIKADFLFPEIYETFPSYSYNTQLPAEYNTTASHSLMQPCKQNCQKKIPLLRVACLRKPCVIGVKLLGKIMH